MRDLINISDNSTIKAGDTSETFTLSARNDNEPQIWKTGDTLKIHIDKDDAHVKDIDATPVLNSNNLTFDSELLADLPAGEYQLELWATLQQTGKTAIFPSDHMLNLTIARNADSLEGGKITTITLADFTKKIDDELAEAKANMKQGPEGKPGKQGEPGLSAYQLAVKSGFKGSESEWLASLSHGPKGDPGKSAYQEWLANGHSGSEADFLNSLIGPQGKPGETGKSAYQVAVDNGFKGTESEWVASLKGQRGDQGQPGRDGADGKPGKDAPAPTFKIGPVNTIPTGQPANATVNKQDDGSWMISLSIPAGPKGDTGGVTQVVKPDLSIGTVTTVAADQPASASLTKTGETTYSINISIPAGKSGKDGKDGVNGQPGKNGSDGKDGKSIHYTSIEPTQWTSEISLFTNNGDLQGIKPGDLVVTGIYNLYEIDEYFRDEDPNNPKLKSYTVKKLGSLKGPQGDPGSDGKPGTPGVDGKNGNHIYVTNSTVYGNYMATTTSTDELNNAKAGDYLIDSNGNVFEVKTNTEMNGGGHQFELSDKITGLAGKRGSRFWTLKKSENFPLYGSYWTDLDGITDTYYTNEDIPQIGDIVINPTNGQSAMITGIMIDNTTAGNGGGAFSTGNAISGWTMKTN
ncbi:hypothetical protein [Limosilactobacillus antri]|uniref:hypothetical protein n=1 Tax=Limosilactobacillus antri TaxID=227943 RepID=UPI001F585647|nr:hypothetical protein [Limosilactobacillus antri]